MGIIMSGALAGAGQAGVDTATIYQKKWADEDIQKLRDEAATARGTALAQLQSDLRTKEAAVAPYTLSEGGARFGGDGGLLASRPKTAVPETPEKVKETEARAGYYKSLTDLNEGAKKRLLDSQAGKIERGATELNPQAVREARSQLLRTLSVNDVGEKVQPDPYEFSKKSVLLSDLMRGGIDPNEANDLVRSSPIISRRDAIAQATAEAAKTPKVGWTGSGPRENLDVGGKSMPRDQFIKERSAQIITESEKAVSTWRDQLGVPKGSTESAQPGVAATPGKAAGMPDTIDLGDGKTATKGTGGKYFTEKGGKWFEVTIKPDAEKPTAAASQSLITSPAPAAAAPAPAPAAQPAAAAAQADPVEQAGGQVEQIRGQLNIYKDQLRTYGSMQRSRDPAGYKLLQQKVAELEAAEREALSKYQGMLPVSGGAAFQRPR